MKLANIAYITIFTLSIYGCGNGTSTSTIQTNYGENVSISQQQLNIANPSNPNFDKSYASPYMIGVLAQVNGVYLNYESNLNTFASNISTLNNRTHAQRANVLNTETLYNFNPTSLTSSNIIESVSAYAIKYYTPGQDSEISPEQIQRTASGLIITPNLKQGQTIKGIVIYYHPTELGKNQVPSCLGKPTLESLAAVSGNQPEYCNLPGNPLGTAGAETYGNLATYAEFGYIIVAPDYLGMGADYNNVHPYAAFPKVNALSGLYMLPSVRKILSSDYGIAQTESLPLFLTGYSEGGAYAVKASELAQNELAQFLKNNNITPTLTSPQEGAYSMMDQMNFTFDNVYDGLFNCPNGNYNGYICGESDVMQAGGTSITTEANSMNSWHIVSAPMVAMGKPILASYIQTAIAYYFFDNATTAYNFLLNSAFWNNIDIGGGKIANLYQIYSGVYGPYMSGTLIGEKLLENTLKITPYDTYKDYKIGLYETNGTLLYESSIKAPLGANNQGTLFMNYGIITNPLFNEIVTGSSTYNWQTKLPINYIHFAYDSIVTVLNSRQAISCMTTGKSFTANESYPTSSAGICTTPPSASNLIAETIVPNYQMTNNQTQQTPMVLNGINDIVNPNAINKFWVAPDYADPKLNISPLLRKILEANDFSMPFDHLQMYGIGNIAALCSFLNYTATNGDSIAAKCPNNIN